uniref:Ion channel n=1 Tax=Panagrellus redivivus TaxID=6233 RepID=A0A7E4VYD8_PANRE
MIAEHVRDLFADIKKGFRGLIPVLVLIVLTVIGAVLFMTLEGPNEEFNLKNLSEEREKLVEETAFRLNGIKSMSPLQAYNHTVKTLIQYREKLGIPEVSLNDTKWTFFGAVYYSMTVYTTIGYGNIYCETPHGRILTIIYAFIGIPTAFLALVSMGSLFARLCMFIWHLFARTTKVVNKDLARKMTELGPDNETASAQSGDEDDLLQFPLSFLLVLNVLWVLFCAWIFTFLEEDWDYGTSLYFTLISFLTIGFGDVVPSQFKYIILIFIMLLNGLAIVSSLLQIIQKQIEAMASGVKDSIDKEYLNALQEAHEEGDVDIPQDASKEGAAAPTDASATDPEAANGANKKAAPRPDQLDPRSLEAVVKRMPWRKRMMFHVMSDTNKKELAQHAAYKSKFVNRGIQTDEILSNPEEKFARNAAVSSGSSGASESRV